MRGEAGTIFDAGLAEEPAGLQRAWLAAALAVGLGWVAVLAAYAGTASVVLYHWINTSYFNHAFLIFPIGLYLIWERRAVFAVVAPRPTAWAVPAALGFAAVWAVAHAVDVNAAKHLALMGILQSVVLAAIGWRAYRLLLFPLLYLWFMVPTGDFLAPLLQSIATDLTTVGMRLSGIPTFVEGIVVETPTGTYVVAEGCAGLNFFLASLAFSLLFANLQYRSNLKRATFVAAMLGASILGNGARIVLIIVVAHVSDRQIDIVDDHILYGWGFFALIMLAMMWIGMQFQDPPIDYAARAARTDGPAKPLPVGRVALATGLTVLLGAAGPLYASALEPGGPVGGQVALTLPAAPEGWAPVAPGEDWTPTAPDADTIVRAAFTTGAGPAVELFVPYYWRQDDGREVVGGTIDASGGGTRISGRTVAVRIGDETVAAREAVLGAGVDRRVVWSWYWIDGRFVVRPLEAKLLQAKALLLRGERRAALVAVSSVGTEAEARAAMTAFLERMPSLAAHLEQASVR